MNKTWNRAVFAGEGDPLSQGSFRGTIPGETPLDPEQRLVLAILEDAVACFQKYVFFRSIREESLFLEAEHWLLEVNSSWVFSFENICEFLGFNPAYLRQGLQRWRDGARLTSHALATKRKAS